VLSVACVLLSLCCCMMGCLLPLFAWRLFRHELRVAKLESQVEVLDEFNVEVGKTLGFAAQEGK
jgi:hypothetical protein